MDCKLLYESPELKLLRKRSMIVTRGSRVTQIKNLRWGNILMKPLRSPLGSMNRLLSAGGYNATQKSMNSGRGRERRVVLCTVLWKTDLDCWRNVLQTKQTTKQKVHHPFFVVMVGVIVFIEKKVVVVKVSIDTLVPDII